MFSAACHGIMRRLSAIKRKRPAPYGDPNLNLWGMDIESCAAEMLVAKWLGKYWNRIAEKPGRRAYSGPAHAALGRQADLA
jgi:hypothetical protein